MRRPDGAARRVARRPDGAQRRAAERHRVAVLQHAIDLHRRPALVAERREILARLERLRVLLIAMTRAPVSFFIAA